MSKNKERLFLILACIPICNFFTWLVMLVFYSPADLSRTSARDYYKTDIATNDIKYSSRFNNSINDYIKYCTTKGVDISDSIMLGYKYQWRPEYSTEYNCKDKKIKLDEIGEKYVRRLNEININEKYTYNIKTYSIEKSKGGE